MYLGKRKEKKQQVLSLFHRYRSETVVTVRKKKVQEAVSSHTLYA